MSDQDGSIFEEKSENNEPAPEGNQEEKVDQPKEEKPNDDPTATLLSEIKREDGTQKYSDVTSALNALKESQTFIETLKTENAELKNKLELYKDKAEKNITMEQILSSITDREESKETPSESPNPQDMEALINDVIERRENTKTVAENLKTVDSAVMEKYNDRDKAAEFLKTRASEIGVGVDFLKDVAGRSPQAAIKLLGLDEKKEPVGTEDVKSTVSPERWSPTNPNKKPNSPIAGSTSDLMAGWNAAKEAVLSKQ